jgi:HAE1 family hydrophobic/amphiphilic exporter-1
MVGLAVFSATKMNYEGETAVDQGNFQVTVTCRKNTALEVADEKARPYEELLRSDPDIQDVDISVNSNVATITAKVKKESGKSTANKVDEYNLLWKDEKGVDIQVKSASSSSSSSGIKVTLTGLDYNVLKSNIYKAMEALSSIEGVLNVSSALKEGSTEAKIHIDPQKAMDAGLNPQSVATTIANINGGVQAIKIKSKGEEYKVRLEYPEGQYDDLYKLMSLKLNGQNNRVVTLGDIAELTYEETPDTISKINGSYSLNITLTTTEEDRFRVKDEADALVKKLNFSGAEQGLDSDALLEKQEKKNIAMAIASSVFLVFLVMAMQFESARFSGMVMMSIPFSFIGAIFLVAIDQSPLSMSAMLGFLMLSGIVVNDGILFVDTANSLKKHFPVKEALARSGELRLRPILMTTLTTILSMLPLLFSKDSGTSIMDGMALIIIGGLSASTLLILFLLPTFYTLFMGRKAKREDLLRFPPDGQAPGKKHSKKGKSKHHHHHHHHHHKDHDADDLFYEDGMSVEVEGLHVEDLSKEDLHDEKGLKETVAEDESVKVTGPEDSAHEETTSEKESVSDEPSQGEDSEENKENSEAK